jgi:hypothetical protein
MVEGLVGAEGFAVDASLIRADVYRQRSVRGEEGLPPEAAGRAVREYLDVLDDAAFGGATPVTPKRINLTDPAARWTAATRDNWLSNRIFTSYENVLDHCCYAWNTLIDQPRRIMSIGLRQWAHRF